MWFLVEQSQTNRNITFDVPNLQHITKYQRLQTVTFVSHLRPSRIVTLWECFFVAHYEGSRVMALIFTMSTFHKPMFQINTISNTNNVQYKTFISYKCVCMSIAK